MSGSVSDTSSELTALSSSSPSVPPAAKRATQKKRRRTEIFDCVLVDPVSQRTRRRAEQSTPRMPSNRPPKRSAKEQSPDYLEEESNYGQALASGLQQSFVDALSTSDSKTREKSAPPPSKRKRKIPDDDDNEDVIDIPNTPPPVPKRANSVLQSFPPSAPVGVVSSKGKAVEAATLPTDGAESSTSRRKQAETASETSKRKTRAATVKSGPRRGPPGVRVGVLEAQQEERAKPNPEPEDYIPRRTGILPDTKAGPSRQRQQSISMTSRRASIAVPPPMAKSISEASASVSSSTQKPPPQRTAKKPRIGSIAPQNEDLPITPLLTSPKDGLPRASSSKQPPFPSPIARQVAQPSPSPLPPASPPPPPEPKQEPRECPTKADLDSVRAEHASRIDSVKERQEDLEAANKKLLARFEELNASQTALSGLTKDTAQGFARFKEDMKALKATFDGVKGGMNSLSAETQVLQTRINDIIRRLDNVERVAKQQQEHYDSLVLKQNSLDQKHASLGALIDRLQTSDLAAAAAAPGPPLPNEEQICARVRMQIETYVVHMVRQIAQDFIAAHLPKALGDIEGWQRLLNMDEENKRKARSVIDRIEWEERHKDRHPAQVNRSPPHQNGNSYGPPPPQHRFQPRPERNDRYPSSSGQRRQPLPNLQRLHVSSQFRPQSQPPHSFSPRNPPLSGNGYMHQHRSQTPSERSMLARENTNNERVSKPSPTTPVYPPVTPQSTGQLQFPDDPASEVQPAPHPEEGYKVESPRMTPTLALVNGDTARGPEDVPEIVLMDDSEMQPLPRPPSLDRYIPQSPQYDNPPSATPSRPERGASHERERDDDGNGSDRQLYGDDHVDPETPSRRSHRSHNSDRSSHGHSSRSHRRSSDKHKSSSHGHHRSSRSRSPERRRRTSGESHSDRNDDRVRERDHERHGDRHDRHRDDPHDDEDRHRRHRDSSSSRGHGGSRDQDRDGFSYNDDERDSGKGLRLASKPIRQ